MQTRKQDPIHPIYEDNQPIVLGLTKREYFAAMAMNGLISTRRMSPGALAIESVQIADHLIRQLNISDSEICEDDEVAHEDY